MKITYPVDELSRAFDLVSRVAPVAKGAAWDAAAGVVMDIDTDGSTSLMATDLDTAAFVAFDCEEIKDEPTEPIRWRMSSLYLANWLKKLSSSITGSHDEKRNALLFKSQRSKLLVPLMDPEGYPELSTPPSEGVEGANLAAIAERVLWACDAPSKGSSVLSGLHIDGTNIVGCRHEGMAILHAPQLAVEKPVTFQARDVMSLVRGYSEVRVSADENKIFLWLNDTDWVSASLLVDPYPKYSKLRRKDDFLGEITVSKSQLLDCLDRMSIIASTDRGNLPKIVFTITKTTLNMKMLIKDVGDSEEVIAIEGGPDTPFEIAFSLGYLSDGVRNVQGDTFSLAFGYASEPTKRGAVRILDASGCEATLMPRMGV